MNEIDQQTYQYDGFISYSRENTSFAERLENALENYRPPKDLDVPQRRLNILRDVGDMTGTEYFQAIERHLRNSAKLILVCSPNARKSELVNDEIRRFATINGAENIIPLLFEGIPNNEATAGHESEMAFPDALIEVVGGGIPLAADFRGFVLKRNRVAHGQFENAFYKTLADIYGKPRSEVEQRERRRQIRRRRVTVGVVASLMVILASLTVWALLERSEAKRQQQAAEVRARIAQSRQLSAQALYVLDNAPDLALLLSVVASRFWDTFEARSSLLHGLEHSPYLKAFLHGHQDLVSAVAFSPDGTRLASVDGHKVILWDLQALQRLAEFMLPDSTVLRGLSFHPTEPLLAVGTDEGAIAIWNWASPNTKPRVLPGHQGAVQSIAFSPNGQRMASGDSQGPCFFGTLLRGCQRHHFRKSAKMASADLAIVPKATSWLRLVVQEVSSGSTTRRQAESSGSWTQHQLSVRK